MRKGPKKTVSVRMPLFLYEWLLAGAQRDDRSVPSEIRQILLGYMEYLDRGGVSWTEQRINRWLEWYQNE